MHIQNPDLMMSEDPLRKLLGQLRSVRVQKHRTTNIFIIGAVVKRYQDLSKLLEIEKLPDHLNR